MKELTIKDIEKSLSDLFEHGFNKDNRPIDVQLREVVKDNFKN